MNALLRAAALVAAAFVLLPASGGVRAETAESPAATEEVPIQRERPPSNKFEGGTQNVLAWQMALEQIGFSPGLVDGRIGAKTALATREFQRVRSLPETGELDAATTEALGVAPAAALTSYTIGPADLADVAPLPTDWLEKSRLDRLRYPSLEQLVAEKFHTSRSCLAQLNPGMNLAGLKIGDALTVPHVAGEGPWPHADRIDVNLSEKVIRLSAGGKLIALFHCSIAKDKAKLPSGDAHVAVISTNPNYTFDPAMWPDVKGIDHKLLIPPGPRNPVGLCWVGLSLPGYGMHGTPTPELIGKTGSHGCFRLTNWDAVRLGRMVSVGTPVHFSVSAAAADKH